MKMWYLAKPFPKRIVTIFIAIALAINHVPVVSASNMHTISGTVSDASGRPVVNVPLRAHSSTGSEVNFMTNGAGYYSISVSPGRYSIDSRDTFNHGSMRGLYLYGPYYASSNPAQYFIDVTVGDVVQNFKLDDIKLNVKLENYRGELMSGWQVSITSRYRQGGTSFATGHPSLKYTTSSNLHSEGITNTTGLASVTALSGISYNICGADLIGSPSVCTIFTPTASSSTVTIKVPTHHVISGRFTDRLGNPVSNAPLRLHSASGQDINVDTDNSGYYSVNVTPGKYTIDSRADLRHAEIGSVYLYGPYYSTSNPAQYFIDAVNGDAIQNLQLDDVPLNVSFNNDANQPIIGAQISVTSRYRQGGTSVAVGLPNLLYTTSSGVVNKSTDTEGKVSISLLRGVLYDVCALHPASLIESCVEYTPTLNQNFLSFGGKIAAPTGLNAHTPTRYSPSIAWSRVDGADGYKVYRNGSVVGSVTSTSFVDGLSIDGRYEYFVKAINDSGMVSEPSSSIYITLDSTPPKILSSASPVANENGWQNSNSTVTFACTDGLSGIRSCELPISVATEGANQLVIGTAIDNAGNVAESVTRIKIDKTSPIINNATMSSRSIVGSDNVTIAASASDTLSGVLRGEYFIGTDPGQGNGLPMTYSNGKLTATAPIGGLSNGQHKLYMRSLDVAGNWSAATPITFTYTASLLQKIKQFVSTLINTISRLLSQLVFAR